MKVNKKLGVIGLGIIAIVLIIAVLFMRNQRKDEILFNKKYYVEYGEDIDYKELIDEIYPEDAEVIYPKNKVDQVGIYELEFKLKGTDKVFRHKVQVKDTKEPEITVHFKKDRQILVNSEYNAISNLDTVRGIEDFSREAIVFKTAEEYNTIKEETEKKSKELEKRKVTENTNMTNEDSNFVIATTNFDNSKEGTYVVKVLAVDRNYISSEKEWKIEVLGPGNIVNTGGTVTCDYIGSELPTNEAFQVTAYETFSYDEDLEVTNVQVVMEVNLHEDYRMDSNINLLINSMETAFSSDANQGISTSYTRNGNSSIRFVVAIDIDKYDVKNDILELFPEGKKSSIDINALVEAADDTGVVCDVK